jgi:putative lipoprotein
MDFSVFCAKFNGYGGESHQRVDNKKGDRSMKLWQIVGGAAALTVTLAGCAQKSADVPVPTAGNPAIAQTQIQGPAVTGSVNIRQRIALPPDAVLTVTLSDASLADAPSKVIAQRAVRTEGKQAPFNFVLPYNPADIQPNARIILSAAITVNGRMMFITDTIQEVVNRNGTRADLVMVPVQGIAVQAAPATMP